jgi:FKBP-type peptidyl-prolyl cis-trans isomerase SlyD
VIAGGDLKSISATHSGIRSSRPKSDFKFSSFELPKKIFEIEGKIDNEILFEGNVVPMMDSSGNRLMGSVVEIGEDIVTMDFNHPLAGENMYFTGKVLGVRDASAEEIAALFSGGGCGCGSCDCGSKGSGAEGEGSCGCGSSNGGGCGSGGCGNC